MMDDRGETSRPKALKLRPHRLAGDSAEVQHQQHPPDSEGYREASHGANRAPPEQEGQAAKCCVQDRNDKGDFQKFAELIARRESEMARNADDIESPTQAQHQEKQDKSALHSPEYHGRNQRRSAH